MNQKNTSITFSGFALKYIALTTMTFDHIAAVLLPYDSVFYTVFRGIGRIAFPVYCFLLVEGYLHTSNRKAYFTRLLLFALISEIPFDMALFHFPSITAPQILMSHQNVFFTLSFGLLVMERMDELWYKNRTLAFVWMAALGLFADILHFDYGMTGILVITILFLCKKHRPDIKPVFMAILAVLPLFSPSSISGLSVALAIPFLVLYNGRKGSPLPNDQSFPGAKYLFYIYYPLHLFLIAIIYFL